MSNNNSLTELHTALIDACSGYDQAIEDTEQSDLRELFERARSLHGKAHEEIHRTLESRSVHPTDEGSFMSTVHKAVISTRSAIVGLDEGSLSSFASGEERIVQAYDKAISENEDDADVSALLTRQKSALIELVREMKSRSARD